MTDLPTGWATAEIGDLLYGITAGKNLKCEERPPRAHERGVIKVSAVTWGTFDASQSKTLPSKFVPAPDTVIRSGDFLFSRANTLELVGAVVLVRSDHPNLFLSDKVLRLDFPPELKPWLLNYLRSFEGRQKLSGVSSGNQMSMRNIGQSSLKSVSVPLPPLREQHRIVAKIEELFSELDKAVESLTLARAQLKTYRQALLKAAFEGKLTADWRAHDRPWRATRLGNEITYLTSGSRGWGDYYSDQGDIFIRAQNLKHDRLDLGDPAYVLLPKKATEGLRTRVQNGDVLITITGANVTKTGIVNRDIGIAYVSQHVALCRPGEALQPEFLYWYLLSDTGGRLQLNSAAYGAGKPGLSLENIREVTLMLPEVDEQDEIIARLNSLISEQEHTAQSIRTETQRISVLRQSVLQRAFSGRLVPQGSEDEPATCLLERIRAAQGAPITVRRKRTAHA